MQTAGSTAKSTILGYFPERIQAALRAYGAAINLAPEIVVQLAIAYFLESAEIPVDINEEPPNVPATQNSLAHLPYSMRQGVEQYVTEYEFPPEAVVELAVTFLLDPDASGFEDCQVGVRMEQVHLLKQYRRDYESKAA